MTFEDWMKRYIDHIAGQAAMERSAAEEMVMSAGEDIYREQFGAGEDPVEAADAELQSWDE